MTQNEFDSWLKQRPLEKADENLPSKISQAALKVSQETTQKGSKSWYQAPLAFMVASFLVAFVLLNNPLPLSKLNDPQEIETISDAELLYDVFSYSDEAGFI